MHLETGAAPEAIAASTMRDFGSRLDGTLSLRFADRPEHPVPMTGLLWSEMVRYRKAVGLPPIPVYGEDGPLVQRALHDVRSMTPAEAARIVHQFLNRETPDAIEGETTSPRRRERK